MCPIVDNVDTAKGSDDFMPFRNIMNDWYARDTSRKIRSVLKAKGQSGKPLSANPPYGYKKSDTDKNFWVIDGEAAKVVRKIFRLCIEGNGPSQIARKLEEEKIPTPMSYCGKCPPKTHWNPHTVSKILETVEYAGHTANFKTFRKSYKNKKKLANDKSSWLIFENTHEPIVSQHDFDLVQELRKNKRRPQKIGTVNVFSGMVYCADCGKKLYLNRAKSMASGQEHFKCSTYDYDKSECSAHYIRTAVLREITISEINKLLATVQGDEDKFIRTAMNNSIQEQASELRKAKKALDQYEKRISELDKLFARIYEDNVAGKISDERFEVMSKNYEAEQAELKAKIPELTKAIEAAKQKTADISQFLDIVRKYTVITELTPEIMHELIEKIAVHAPDKSSGHRRQQVDIHFRFRIATAEVEFDSKEINKRAKAA